MTRTLSRANTDLLRALVDTNRRPPDVDKLDMARALAGEPVNDHSYHALRCAFSRAEGLYYDGEITADQIRALAVAVISQAVADLTDPDQETRRNAYQWIHGGLWRTHWAHALGVQGKRGIFLRNLSPQLSQYDRLEVAAGRRLESKALLKEYLERTKSK